MHPDFTDCSIVYNLDHWLHIELHKHHNVEGKKKKRLVNVYGSNFVLDFWGKIKGIHLFIFTFHLLWAKFFSPTLRLCSRWIDITLKKKNSVGKWNPLPSIYWNWDNNCSVRTSMWYSLVICCPQGILCTTCIIISLLIIPRSSFN